jgi:hypothetical protein
MVAEVESVDGAQIEEVLGAGKRMMVVGNGLGAEQSVGFRGTNSCAIPATNRENFPPLQRVVNLEPPGPDLSTEFFA